MWGRADVGAVVPATLPRHSSGEHSRHRHTLVHLFGPCGAPVIGLFVVSVFFLSLSFRGLANHQTSVSEVVVPPSVAIQHDTPHTDEDRWRRLKDQGGAQLSEHGSQSAAPQHASATPTTAPPKGRVALLFFGVPGSRLFTLESVHRSVVSTIEAAGYQPTVFAHSFEDDSFPGGLWRPLELFQYNVTSSTGFLKGTKSGVRACKELTSDIPYVNAVLGDLKSLQEVGSLWESHYLQQPEAYHAVVFLRADVFYAHKFPVEVLPKIQEGEVLVPSFGSSDVGLNDRLAVMRPATAQKWAHQLPHALQKCRKELLNAERFLHSFSSESLIKAHKLPHDFVFFRVSASGDVLKPDRKLPGYDNVRGQVADILERRRAAQHDVHGDFAFQKLPAMAPASSFMPLTTSRASLPKQQMTPLSRVNGERKKQPLPTSQPTPPQKHVDPLLEGFSNTVAVCSLMKDEEVDDVMEWLQYHRWLGVDKVFLRENGATVSKQYMHALQDMQDDGFLDFGAWEGQSPAAQQEWYNRCSQEDLGGAFSWILFSDLDEYPVHINGGAAVEEPDIKGFLMRHRGAAGLTLQWVLFGSSGHRERPPGGPLHHFSTCSNELSYQMKCLASSYHLSAHPFTAPILLHACCYEYDAEQPQQEWAPVLYGDGRRASDDRIKNMYSLPADAPEDTRTPEQREAVCRTYQGHLQERDYARQWRVPQTEALVLFHYVTRSFEDFRERKLKRYAGGYANDFRVQKERAMGEQGDVPSDEELFDALESRMGITQTSRVCKSAVKAGYSDRCCS